MMWPARRVGNSGVSGSVAGQKGQPTVTANAVVSVQPIALTRKGNKEPTYTAQRLPCNPESVLTPQMGPRRRPPRPVGHLLVFMKFSWLFYDFFRPFRVRSMVGGKNDMSLALERVLAPAPGLFQGLVTCRSSLPQLSVR